MFKFHLLFVFLLFVSSAQAMLPEKLSGDIKLTQEEIQIFLQLMQSQQPLSDPYIGMSPFEKEINQIIDTDTSSEKKMQDIISLINTEKIEISYEEKVNTTLDSVVTR
jgi:hypothetical protein